MAEWVYVQNGQILEYHGALPRSWRDISGLDRASAEFLQSVGWLPVEKNHSAVNTKTQKLVGYSYEIFPTKVIETTQIVELTSDEINELIQRQKTEFMNGLRRRRDELLKNSDWTQMTDVVIIKPQEWVNSWRLYRQQLRDLPTNYENVADISSVNISWPSSPEN